MSKLEVWTEVGQPLFDTDLISYGLIKSGYMSYFESWTRRVPRGTNVDPNIGTNYSPVVVSNTFDAGDNLWGFTVYNAISPVVFITGSGALVGSNVSGNGITFLYANASASTKFFCFDLMADNMVGTTSLKTWDVNGRITFNSLQQPQNVVAAIQAPGPGALDRFGRYPLVYAGGSIERWRSNYATPGVACVIDMPLSPGTEYAAHLPWSRSAECYDVAPAFPASGPFYRYGSVEGVGGYVGGIRFRMTSSPGTSYVNLTGNQFTPNQSWSNLPVDRFPVALVIHTAGLNFPYN